jgi:hypothetical protein
VPWVALIALMGCSTSSSIPTAQYVTSTTSPPTVGVVSDSGFRPHVDGFAFENYGSALPDGTTPTNLTAEDVLALFGDGVCAVVTESGCHLIPQAEAWMEQMNDQMANGHCFGLSVAANLVWQEHLEASSYGAPTITALDIHDNRSLQRTLAYAWVFQTLESVRSNRITGEPNEMLDALRTVLQPNATETYTLIFWKSDLTAGHAVTPYAVEHKGGGVYDVLVYDNNWPQETRAITFDTGTNTWHYFGGATPDEPGSLYSGSARSESLHLLPTSPGRSVQPCPFCATASAERTSVGAVAAMARSEATTKRMAAIYLTADARNHSRLLITDAQGRRLGRIDGEMVNEIPDASFVIPTSDEAWNNEQEPTYYVPTNQAYTIELDGSPLTGPVVESLRILGPSWHIAVKDIPMGPGDKDTVVADPINTTLSYTTTRAKSPTMHLAVSEPRARYAFVIDGISSDSGSRITLDVPPGGGSMTMDNVGSSGSSTVAVEVTRYTPSGLHRFRHDGIVLSGGVAADLQYGVWADPADDIPLVVTRDGQRTTEVLGNTAGS